jgi:hypothetical protein
VGNPAHWLFTGGGDERKHFSLGRNINGGHISCDRSRSDSTGRVTATDDGVGVSMDFFDRISWKLLLIAGPLALTIIVPGIYLIWQGVGK